MELKQKITPQFKIRASAPELMFVFLGGIFLVSYAFFMRLVEITLQMFSTETKEN